MLFARIIFSKQKFNIIEQKLASDSDVALLKIYKDGL